MIYDINGYELVGEVTPEMYGAAGDGTTDDTTALATMFNDSSNNNASYCLNGTYAITSPVNVHGHIFGNGTICALNDARVTTCFFNVSGDTEIEGLTFDTDCSVAYSQGDGDFNIAIRTESNPYNVRVANCKFVNGYNCFFMARYISNGCLEIVNCNFDADNEVSQYNAKFLYFLTITGETGHIRVEGCDFIGNGDPVDNFGGIFLAGIANERTDVVNNTFNKVGNDGLYRMYNVDAYWNVDNLNVIGNKFLNVVMSAVRVHGGNHIRVAGNLISTPNADTNYAAVLVDDDISSTGLDPIGVSDVCIENNIFRADTIWYNSVIQLTSNDGTENSAITNVTIQNNNVDGGFKTLVLFDGSVKDMNIADNVFKTTYAGISFYDGNRAFTSDNVCYIQNNFFSVLGGSTIRIRGIEPVVYITNNMIDSHGWAIQGDAGTLRVRAFHNSVKGSTGARGFTNIYTAGNNDFELSTTAEYTLDGITKQYNNYLRGTLIS